MRPRKRSLAKALPGWALVLFIIVGTAGAATGAVLAGRVTGVTTATVSQSLLIKESPGTKITNADRALFTVSDDGAKFTAGAEVNTGDAFKVKMALANVSDSDVVGELILVGPEGITLGVDSVGDTIPDAVRVGPFTWKFELPPSDNNTTDLTINIALADDMPPGFYAIDGQLEQVAQ